MTKKHEELVGEITQDILEYYRPDGFVEVMKWDREFAESLITLILSAVRDGRLDEELGVVGRYSLLPPTEHRTYSEWALDMHIERNANDFIALRKEGKPEPEFYGDYGEFESGETDPKYQSGTGKEE